MQQTLTSMILNYSDYIILTLHIPIIFAPCNENNFRLLYGLVNCNFVPRTNLIVGANEAIGLDKSKLVDDDKAFDALEFSIVFFKNNPLQHLDRFVGKLDAGITWVLHDGADRSRRRGSTHRRCAEAIAEHRGILMRKISFYF